MERLDASAAAVVGVVAAAAGVDAAEAVTHAEERQDDVDVVVHSRCLLIPGCLQRFCRKPAPLRSHCLRRCFYRRC